MNFRLFPVGLLIFLFFLSTATLFGQSSPSQPSPQDDIIRQSVTIVSVEALVLDKKSGTVAGGLQASDFEIFDNGVKQRIEQFSVDRNPLSIVLVLDVSRSVRPILGRIATGGVAAFSRLKPEDEVAVMAFASKTRLVQNFTRDRATVLDSIRRIDETSDVGSGTNLLQAIADASKIWGNATQTPNFHARRVIVVVTDNLSYVPRGASKTTIEATKRDLLESGATLCGIVVGDTRTARGIIATNPLSWFALRSYRLEPFAEETGGEVLNDRQSEVETTLGSLFERLRSRYSLAYIADDTSFDGSFRRLKVVLAPSVNPKGRLVIKTRSGYWTPKPEQNPEKDVID